MVMWQLLYLYQPIYSLQDASWSANKWWILLASMNNDEKLYDMFLHTQKAS